jgi:hypothetical protein
MDYVNDIALDHKCNVYVTGASDGLNYYPDYVTVGYDSSGVEQWVTRYEGPASTYDYAIDMDLDAAGYVYVTGSSFGTGTDLDYATIKYAPTGVEESRLTARKSTEITATIFSGPLILPEGKKCKVYDITGRVVTPARIQPGIYFIEVDGVVTQKVVKVR